MDEITFLAPLAQFLPPNFLIVPSKRNQLKSIPEIKSSSFIPQLSEKLLLD